VGDGGSGQGAFLRGLAKDIVDAKYVHHLGVWVYDLVLSTDRGYVMFIVYAAAGQQEEILDRVRAFVQCECAIVTFSVNDRITYKNAPEHYRNITRIREDMPIVVVGNQVRVETPRVKDTQSSFHRKKNLPYYQIDTTHPDDDDGPFTRVDHLLPFRCLARKLLAHPTLLCIPDQPGPLVEPQNPQCPH
jgi:GTP-binding nuclear protein Ran